TISRASQNGIIAAPPNCWANGDSWRDAGYWTRVSSKRSDLVAGVQFGRVDRALDERLQHGDQGIDGLGLAVHEESRLDLAAVLLVPPAQVVAVGVAGEAVQHVDRRVQVVPLVEDLDPLDALGDLAAQRPLGLVADDHDRVVRVGDDMPEVVADPARLAHP